MPALPFLVGQTCVSCPRDPGEIHYKVEQISKRKGQMMRCGSWRSPIVDSRLGLLAVSKRALAQNSQLLPTRRGFECEDRARCRALLILV